MKKQILSIFALCSAALFTACEKEVIKEVEKVVYINENFDPEKAVIKLGFKHTIGNQDFELKKSFTDAEGNTYSFNEVRYWVSNVKFVKANGEEVAIPDSYYLVENRDTLFYYGTTAANVGTNFSAPKKREEVLVGNVPQGDYTKVKFAIGVDPKYNNNFAIKAGELDINQMSQVAGWAWHTSYIFLRTKGAYLPKGGNALTDAVRFVAETGGNDQYREVEIALNSPINAKAGSVSEVALKTDVLELFKGLTVSAFSGSKPAGWAADPNLNKYDKFVNASSPEDMKKLADNTKVAIK